MHVWYMYVKVLDTFFFFKDSVCGYRCTAACVEVRGQLARVAVLLPVTIWVPDVGRLGSRHLY